MANRMKTFQYLYLHCAVGVTYSASLRNYDVLLPLFNVETGQIYFDFN